MRTVMAKIWPARIATRSDAGAAYAHQLNRASLCIDVRVSLRLTYSMRLKKITSGWFAFLDEVYRHFVPRLISAGMLQGSLNDYFDDKGFLTQTSCAVFASTPLWILEVVHHTPVLSLDGRKNARLWLRMNQYADAKDERQPKRRIPVKTHTGCRITSRPTIMKTPGAASTIRSIVSVILTTPSKKAARREGCGYSDAWLAKGCCGVACLYGSSAANATPEGCRILPRSG
jgi:hypothetical protein